MSDRTRPNAADYSFDRPRIAKLVAAGIKLVARYLSNTAAKNLTAREAAALHKAGIGVLLNWESSSGRPLGGAPNGRQDGKAAAALAERIGAPHGLTIYFSCDVDTDSQHWPLIAAYYAAAGEALHGRYQVGVYGEADLIDYLHRQGVVTSEWQTYAWSNGELSANADLFQYLNGQELGGGAVDFDRIIHPDKLGAWWPEHTHPTEQHRRHPVDQYTVKAGDTLIAIARAENIAVHELVAANVEKYPSLNWNPDLIQIGWRLTIPGREPAPAAAKAPAKKAPARKRPAAKKRTPTKKAAPPAKKSE